ncbi:hypothetical protein NIES4103_18640 [Nostoc sp. NIES-4103]|nr:hypothetical protein NIES4103_18640 [Nostoc sp. NIES-4103]
MHTLTFKGNPIEAHQTYQGLEIIITYWQPDKFDIGYYFWYIRNSDLEILADNSKNCGCDNLQSAATEARFAIDNLVQ